VFAVFPATSLDPGCLMGPKDAITLNSLINLEGEMICLLSSAESLGECLRGFTSKAAEKRAKIQGSLTFPSASPPVSACSVKVSAHQGSKIRNLLRGHSLFIAPSYSSVQ